MNWLQCIEIRSYIAGEDLRFDFRGINDLDSNVKEFDINCDGVTTISDIWEFIKYTIHIPGDWILSSALDAKQMQFLELDSPYNTYFSSIIGWTLATIIVVIAVKELIFDNLK